MRPAAFTSMRMILNCSGLYFFCNFAKLGSSLRHGAHHGAQKLTRVTVPLKSFSVCGVPSFFCMGGWGGRGIRSWYNTTAAIEPRVGGYSCACALENMNRIMARYLNIILY